MKIIRIKQSDLSRLINEQIDAVNLGRKIYNVGKTAYDHITKTDNTKKPTEPKKNEHVPCTPENVWNEINKLGIKHPDIVFTQAKLESGHFKSNKFQEFNSLFGMKKPMSRPNVVNKEKSIPNHAYYDTWQDSVKDYKLWQDYWSIEKNGKRVPINTITDKCGYIDALDRLYCKTGTCDPKHPERNRPYSTLLLDMVKDLKCKFEKI